MESSAYTLAEVEAAHAAQDNRYLQFLTIPEMSLGLYNLPAGAEDLQTPHLEDEIYYVVSGRGRLTAGDQDYPAEPGSILFVAREVPHKFHGIEEDLHILVFFAPAHSG
jgi:mannose-6-phosphate isomerase-like protein (cupin superfamily)